MGNNQLAPGELELVRSFVNTREIDVDRDDLATVADAQAWLDANDLGDAREPLDEADRARLVVVREALRALLHANNAGEPPPAEALATLNEQAQASALGLRFEPQGAELVSTCGGVDSAIAELLARVHEAMRVETWPRLKACRADDCQWAFYDHSRNHSGTWCVMGECGNRAKARAYRERQRR